jgi:hypothetical protein
MSKVEIVAAIGAVFAVAGGVLADCGWYATAMACAMIAICCGVAIGGMTA